MKRGPNKMRGIPIPSTLSVRCSLPLRDWKAETKREVAKSVETKTCSCGKLAVVERFDSIAAGVKTHKVWLRCVSCGVQAC